MIDWMPKVISLSSAAKWRDGAVTGDLKDAEFGFLGLFQEILPEDLMPEAKSSKKKRKQVYAAPIPLVQAIGTNSASRRK